MAEFFDFLDAINKKEDVELDMNEYNPFMVNRGLSYFKDTVLWANVMNQHPHLDGDIQFRFLKGVVSKKKRYSKWAKAEKTDNIELIQEFYGVNRHRAKEYLSLLNNEQVQIIQDKMFRGGKS